MIKIKFQGVDDNNKLYDLHAINYSNMTGLCQVEGVNGWCWCRFKTFRQFTGEPDKNGKEIYKGDIIKYMDNIFIVEFQMARFKALLLKREDDTQILGTGLWKDVEIIGNIYENPELLNQ